MTPTPAEPTREPTQDELNNPILLAIKSDKPGELQAADMVNSQSKCFSRYALSLQDDLAQAQEKARYWCVEAGAQADKTAQAQAREEKLREALLCIVNNAAPHRMSEYQSQNDLASHLSRIAEKAIIAYKPQESDQNRKESNA